MSRLRPTFPWFRLVPLPQQGVLGSGTANEIAYFDTASTIASLTTVTYPSLTELAFVKGVTSAIQTQFTGKANTALSNLASVAINTTLVSDTYNTDALGTTAIAWSDLFLGSGAVIEWSSAASTSDVTLTHSLNTLTFAGGDVVGLGATTATTFNGLAITANGTNTLAIAAGKTFTVNNTLTLAGTDGTTMTFPGTSATIARTDAANTFTGVQSMTSPDITTSLTTPSTTFALVNATATTINFAGAATTLNIGASATCILNFGGSTTASEFRFLEPSGSGTNYSAFKAVAQAASITYSLPPTVGAAGTYLKDAAGDGVLTWATAGGTTTPSIILSTTFETAGRFSASVNGGGVNTFGTDALYTDTSATGTSSAEVAMNINGAGGKAAQGSPTVGFSVINVNFGTDFTLYCGLGAVSMTGSGATFTNRHIGWKVLRASSGTASLYATQADQTTENASAALATVGAGSNLDLLFKINSTTSVDYYYRLDDGDLSSATNMTTNLVVAFSGLSVMDCALSNVAVASRTRFNWGSMNYSR